MEEIIKKYLTNKEKEAYDRLKNKSDRDSVVLTRLINALCYSLNDNKIDG